MARPLETPAALPQRVPSGPNNASRAGTKYVVLAGDTLYGIAGKHYGKRSGALVRAIVAANRDALQDPDKLRVGAVLLLPELGVEKVVATGSAGAPAAPASRGILAASESKPPRAFGWYQVQRGDRYASIARKQLGDAKRWREVFELNKEKFPDPDRIRDGVLIKIPKSPGGAQH
jgi:nucleoid-associated protein YgaU